MEIIDLTKIWNKNIQPICKLEERLYLRERVESYDYPFTAAHIINYYSYDIEGKKITKINKGKEKIVLDFFQQKTIEGEEGFYYITVKKQLLINEYSLNSVNTNTSDIITVLKFDMDKKYDELLVERLDIDRFLVFFKEEHKFTFEEFENFETPVGNYGYDKAMVYNTSSGIKIEVKDKSFLRGIRLVFFKTTLRNKECVVYEENYLEPYDKEQIYTQVKRGRKSKKDQFFYWDRLRYLSLKKFIREIEDGCEKLSFIDIENQGIDGYEFFSGVDIDNIYYEINKFGKENSNAIIILNKESLEKISIKLSSDDQEDSIINSYDYSWDIDGKYKVIFQKKLISKEKYKVKEIINGNINYTYGEKLGNPKACINNRYLITFTNGDSKKTSIIDMETNKVETYKGEHRVFDDYLVLY